MDFARHPQRSHGWQTCLVYLDDVVVFSDLLPEHLQRLMTMLKAIKNSVAAQKGGKIRFEYHEFKFLGHVVSAAEVRSDPAKRSAVANLPTQENKKQVRSFLQHSPTIYASSLSFRGSPLLLLSSRESTNLSYMGHGPAESF